MPISDDLVGTALPTTTFAWGPTDAIVYALGVGARPPLELDLLDEQRGPVVLPTFALVANWWALKDVRSVLDTGGLPIVHAAQSLEVARPLPPEGEVKVAVEVAAVWDKGRHALFELAGTGTDADGVVFRARSASMVLGGGGWGGERGPATATDDADGPPTSVVDDEVRPEQAAVYRLSGDRNPLHIDPTAARAAGFDDVFLHGLCTFGFAARAVIAVLGDGDPTRLRSISCRFSTPVALGAPLRTEIRAAGDGTATFRSLQGEVVRLAAGRAEVAP